MMTDLLDAKTLERLAHNSGDPWSGPKWFERAENHIVWLWQWLIWPIIFDCDFAHTLDLAAGRGRSTAFLVKIAQRITVMDIQPNNVAACRTRFRECPVPIEFVVNSGYDMKPVDDSSVTLVYCFDSMVHFDSDVVRSYLRDTFRVLRPGGRAFFHHSNSTFGSDWKNNLHGRNFMTADLFKHYAEKERLRLVKQHVIDWAYKPNLDCLSMVEKPLS